MDIRKIAVKDLKPTEYNPRVDLKPGDEEYERLKRSIETFGYVEPVIWNKQTGNIVGGHQRLKVLIELGHEEVDCVVVNLDENNEKALNVALNKISGDWDMGKLEILLKDLDADGFDLDITGFDFKELEAMLGDDGVIEDDFDGELSENPVAKIGDVFVLGRHKLMCGDSTNSDDVNKLMGGGESGLIFNRPAIQC